MLIHFAFVAFVPLGGFGAWVVPGLVWPHALSVAWGIWVMGCNRQCPLTAAENWGRAGLGLPLLPEEGFIAHYIGGRLYPVSWERRVQVAALGAVAISYAGLALNA